MEGITTENLNLPPLSHPEAMLLKKVMTLKLIGIFFGVVTLCIIISGYVFNMIL